MDVYDNEPQPCAECGEPIEPLALAWISKMAYCCSETCARRHQAKS